MASSMAAMGDDAELAEAFHRDGFARATAATTAGDLAHLAGLLDGVYGRAETIPAELVHRFSLTGTADSDASTSLEILETLRIEPALATTAIYQRCQRLAGLVLGCQPELFFDHAIRKPAAIGTGTPWHQDIIYDRYEPDRDRVHFWIPTGAVELDGGCMEFIPRSHLAALVRHEVSDADPTGHARVARGVPESELVAVPVSAGEMTVHHQRTLHRTGPNASNAHRTAWILQFAGPRTPRERALETARRANRLGRRLLARKR